MIGTLEIKTIKWLDNHGSCRMFRAAGSLGGKVLNSLGADSTTGSQFWNEMGRFPNHIPNPDNKLEAMESIKQVVLANEASWDHFRYRCDRSAVVSASGTAINRNNSTRY